ncbi:MAG: hypothetical protein DRO16_03810 [Thermoprotei archaeon]|nr:MAG: hypothetical protein DRO16_03810 [Thermoprotei archaeon]
MEFSVRGDVLLEALTIAAGGRKPVIDGLYIRPTDKFVNIYGMNRGATMFSAVAIPMVAIDYFDKGNSEPDEFYIGVTADMLKFLQTKTVKSGIVTFRILPDRVELELSGGRRKFSTLLPTDRIELPEGIANSLRFDNGCIDLEVGDGIVFSTEEFEVQGTIKTDTIYLNVSDGVAKMVVSDGVSQYETVIGNVEDSVEASVPFNYDTILNISKLFRGFDVVDFCLKKIALKISASSEDMYAFYLIVAAQDTRAEETEEEEVEEEESYEEVDA